MKTTDRHSEYINLLPAYLGAMLDPIKTAEVAAHVSSCSECRTELQLVRTLQNHLDQSQFPLSALQTSEREQHNFDRLWARIEASQSTDAVLNRRVVPSLKSNSVQRWWLPLAAIAATLVIAVELQWYKNREAPNYRTLADTTIPVACGQLRVRFVDNFSAVELQNLLRALDVRIVDGPTPHGVYTLYAKNPDAALRGLHFHPSVQLAEPTGC